MPDNNKFEYGDIVYFLDSKGKMDNLVYIIGIIYILICILSGLFGAFYRTIKEIQQYKKQIEKEQDLREKSGLYFWL